MLGLDHSDNVFKAQRTERLPDDLARSLRRETTSPRIGMKVVAELDLWPRCSSG
jgi:hypothetical protein